jgi:hypothetical protein
VEVSLQREETQRMKEEDFLSRNKSNRSIYTGKNCIGEYVRNSYLENCTLFTNVVFSAYKRSLVTSSLEYESERWRT